MNLNYLLNHAQKYLSGTPPEVGAKVERLIKDAPAPVIWLLGKTQSGKSSIVRTVTAASDVEIGEGYKACTKTSSLYAYPSEETPLLHFLDTRGLFEAAYDESEDIAVLQKQAHLLLVVVKANDTALDELRTILRRIRKKQKHWPMIVAQTCLHESYEGNREHLQPYPFDTGASFDAKQNSQLSKLQEQLSYQRQVFAEFNANFIPIDFTSPDDGFAPIDYGREQLLDAIEEALPHTVWKMVRSLQPHALAGDYWKAAQPHVIFYSALSGGAAAVPIPFTDMPLVTAIQLKMLHSIAGVYGQKLTYERIAEVVGIVGASYLSKLGWKAVLKFVPGGNFAYAAYSSAVSFALGNAFCAYFQYLKEGVAPDKAKLRSLFSERMQAAEKIFRERPKRN